MFSSRGMKNKEKEQKKKEREGRISLCKVCVIDPLKVNNGPLQQHKCMYVCMYYHLYFYLQNYCNDS